MYLAATLRVIAIQNYIIALVFIASKLLYGTYANLQSTSKTPVQSTILDIISIHQQYYGYLPVFCETLSVLHMSTSRLEYSPPLSA